MGYTTEKTTCPNCGEVHHVDFLFYSPGDNDTETEEVECTCGTSFELVCTAEVEVNFYVGEPENVILPEKPESEEDPEVPYVSKDPNQLSISI